MRKILTLCVAVMLFATGCNSENTSFTDESDQSFSETDKQSSVTTEKNSEEDIIIRVATNSSVQKPLNAIISEFNLADNGYKIELVRYKSDTDVVESQNTVDGLMTADLDLQMDIIQGEAVDIVPDSAFYDKGTYDNLAQKGAFTDLNEFLDEELRSELNTHILELHETNGKLYQMPIFYGIETQTGMRKYVGTKENWTFDEMTAKWSEAPEDVLFTGHPTRWNVYQQCIKRNLGMFVDYENMTCDFTSPDFVRFLDFCMQFPENDSGFSFDEGAPKFMSIRLINGILAMHGIICDENSETYTLVGYPSKDGNGSFIDTKNERWSICTKSAPEVQEGAWEFFEMLLSEDYQYNHDRMMSDWINEGKLNEYGFPVNTKALSRKAEEAMTEPLSPNYEDTPLMTQAEYDHITEFIGSLSRMNTTVDSSIQAIVDEEVEACLAGVRSGEEAAKIIQGRVEIMLSERS